MQDAPYQEYAHADLVPCDPTYNRRDVLLRVLPLGQTVPPVHVVIVYSSQDWEVAQQAKAGVGRWITFYNHSGPTPPMADSRPPWATSTRSQPTNRGRE